MLKHFEFSEVCVSFFTVQMGFFFKVIIDTQSSAQISYEQHCADGFLISPLTSNFFTVLKLLL